jgi:hypothetical protein
MPPLIEEYDDADTRIAQKREGVYHFDGGSLELTVDDTRLVAKLRGQPALDLMLNPTKKQKKQFTELNRRTRDAMDKLKAGRENDFADIMREGEDPVARTGVLLNRIRQIGNLDSLHVIGTFANAAGSRFVEYGPWTTFVYTEFANWNQYWNIVWNNDGTFEGDYSGPWPTFILVPTSEDQYTGVGQGPPWDTIEILFDNDCLIVEKVRACS